jgi:hypothetical protein
MPFISASRITGFLLAVAFVAAPAQAQEMTPADIVGVYQGFVSSSGAYWEITTTFKIDEAGQLVGSYIYDENGGSYMGELSRIRLTDDRKIVTIWSEALGSGVLEAEFSEGFSAFTGLWSGLEDDDAVYPWVGKRLE